MRVIPLCVLTSLISTSCTPVPKPDQTAVDQSLLTQPDPEPAPWVMEGAQGHISRARLREEWRKAEPSCVIAGALTVCPWTPETITKIYTRPNRPAQIVSQPGEEFVSVVLGDIERFEIITEDEPDPTPHVDIVNLHALEWGAQTSLTIVGVMDDEVRTYHIFVASAGAGGYVTELRFADAR